MIFAKRSHFGGRSHFGKRTRDSRDFGGLHIMGIFVFGEFGDGKVSFMF
jgi:hypothetical protein